MERMIRTLLISLMVGAFSLLGDETKDNDAVLDTIAQMNHMNWVVTKINHYNNAIVLEEEYKKISPGMLNLNRIPDKETLDKIMALLDELHSMRKDERDMKYWRDHFDAECRQKQLEHWNSRIGNVVDKMGNVAADAVKLGP